MGGGVRQKHLLEDVGFPFQNATSEENRHVWRPAQGFYLDSSLPSHLRVPREKKVDPWPSDADEPAGLPPTSQTLPVFDVSLSSLSMLMENEHVNKREPGSSWKLLEWKLDLADENSLKLEN